MIEVKINGNKLDLHFAVDKLDASNSESAKASFKATDLSAVKQADIHLDTLQFIDSSGVGALLSIYKALQAESAEVTLLHPTPPVLTVLELLRLHRIFTIKMN